MFIIDFGGDLQIQIHEVWTMLSCIEDKKSSVPESALEVTAAAHETSKIFNWIEHQVTLSDGSLQPSSDQQSWLPSGAVLRVLPSLPLKPQQHQELLGPLFLDPKCGLESRPWSCHRVCPLPEIASIKEPY